VISHRLHIPQVSTFVVFAMMRCIEQGMRTVSSPLGCTRGDQGKCLTELTAHDKYEGWSVGSKSPDAPHLKIGPTWSSASCLITDKHYLDQEVTHMHGECLQEFLRLIGMKMSDSVRDVGVIDMICTTQ
jgi:hypothetical protein